MMDPRPHVLCIADAVASLQAARLALQEEISSYPTPISGCDAQFNHLISERQKITNALAALQEQPFVPTPRSPSIGAGIETR
jgi:hypothetical protein